MWYLQPTFRDPAKRPTPILYEICLVDNSLNNEENRDLNLASMTRNCLLELQNLLARAIGQFSTRKSKKMPNEKISLSLEKCFKPFDQGFNRVKYFSCITDSLDAEALPDEWVIKTESGISYGMTEPNNKAFLADGFKHFIKRYLVRDCIESFALCLDELFFFLLLHGKTVASGKSLHDALSDEEKERQVAFENAGLYGKIDKLDSQFNLKLSSDHKRAITSLKDIRNCFAHSNGVVRAGDGRKDGKEKRKFSWMVASVFGIGIQSGERQTIELNRQLSEEIHVGVEIKQQFKSFKKGEALSFSSAEAYEIAWSLHLAAAEYLKGLTVVRSAEKATQTR